MTIKLKPKNKNKNFFVFINLGLGYLRELMREPPDKTTEKAPLSLPNLSESWAVYLARDTARSSSDSNTSFFTSPFSAFAAIETLAPLLLQQQRRPNSFLGSITRDNPLNVEALMKTLCVTPGEIIAREEEEEGAWKSGVVRRVVWSAISNAPVFVYKSLKGECDSDLGDS